MPPNTSFQMVLRMFLLSLLLTPSILIASSTTTTSVGSSVIQQLLMSIEEKLRSLDSLGNTMRFSGLHYGMDQMSRRMDALEVRLSHLESKLETRLDKISEAVMLREAQDRSLLEHISRRMDMVLLQRTPTTAKAVPTITTTTMQHLDKLNAKMETLERNTVGLMDSILENTVRMEEKHTELEPRMGNIQETIMSMQQFLREELSETVSKRIENSSSFLRVEESLADVTDMLYDALTNHSFQSTCSEDRHTQADDGEEMQVSDLEPADTPFVGITNTSESLAEAIGEKRFQQLDLDIEIYTRKVMNTYQELFREIKVIDGSLKELLDQGNLTRFILREGLRKLYQQMKPLSTTEEHLHLLLKKINELGATVDTSFASLLVAQNTFITTCHRVQHQEPVIETKIYHLLQKLVQEIEKRSASYKEDCSLKDAFENHRKDVGKALHDLVWTVIAVGNQTTEDLKRRMTTSNSGNCSMREEDNRLGQQQNVTQEEQDSTTTVASEDEERPRMSPQKQSGMDIVPERLYEIEEDDLQSSGDRRTDYDYKDYYN